MKVDNQIGGAPRLLLDLFGVERSFVSSRSEIGQQIGGFQGLCHTLRGYGTPGNNETGEARPNP
jgi:hypothetical protein